MRLECLMQTGTLLLLISVWHLRLYRWASWLPGGVYRLMGTGRGVFVCVGSAVTLARPAVTPPLTDGGLGRRQPTGGDDAVSAGLGGG